MRAALALLLVAFAAVPATAAPVEVTTHSDGPPADLVWDTHGTPLPGDDDIYMAQSISSVEVRAVDPVPGVLPAVALQANLRDLRVQEPALLFVRAADERLAPVPLPAGFVVGHDDITFTADIVNPLNEHGGPMAATLDDPNPDTWGPPVTVDDQSVSVEPTLTSNSDRFVQRVDASLTEMCFGIGADARYAVAEAYPPLEPSGPRCPHGALAPWAGPLLPTLHGRYELQDVTLLVDAAAQQARGILRERGASPLAAVAGVAGTAPPEAGSDALLPDAAAGLASLAWGAEPGAPGQAERGLVESGSDASLVGQRAPAVVLALAAGLGMALLAVPLYRRLVQRDVAGHPVRQRILDLVAANPGVHEMQAAKELGISHTLAQYHVRMLVEFGALELKRFGGKKCLFVPGQAGRAEKTLLVAERAGKGGQVLDLVAAQPGIGQRALSRQLGMRESSVKWHLDRLAEQGLVHVERTPAGKHVRLSDDAQRARAAPARFTLQPRPEPQGPAPQPQPLHADLPPAEVAA